MAIRALHLNGKTTDALLLLNDLQQQPLTTEQNAEAWYIRYRLLPQDERARQKAIDRFQELYAATPYFLYQRRLEKLKK